MKRILALILLTASAAFAGSIAETPDPSPSWAAFPQSGPPHPLIGIPSATPIFGQTQIFMTGLGPFVANHCPKFDAFNNIIDSGSACGTGGGGLADPGSNGIVFRNALNSTQVVTIAVPLVLSGTSPPVLSILNQSTQTGAFNALAPAVSAPATGSIMWFNAAGNWVSLSGNITSTNCLTESSGGIPAWASCATGAGTVTGATFTAGIISVSGSTTLAFTVAGTSGGIPYFASSSSWASSGVLAANCLIKGGGAGAAPTCSSVTDNGTTLATADSLTLNGSSSGSFVISVSSTAATLSLGSNATLTAAGALTVTSCSGCSAGAGTVTHTVGALTLGYPVVGNAAADIQTVPQTIDASVQAGADACAKISAAAIAINTATSGNGGIVDARGFFGSQTCAGSMFASWPAANPPITILLGPATFVVAVAQNPPSHASIIGQLQWGIPATPAGTVIQAGTTFPTSTAVVSIGAGAAAQGVKLSGFEITCKPPTGSNIAGCIPLQNDWGQEGVAADMLILDGGTDTGFEMSTANAQNSGPFTRILVTMNGVSAAGAQCMRIGAASAQMLANTTFDNISCDASANGTQSTNGILISAAGVRMSSVKMKQPVTGILVGSLRAAHSIHLDNISCLGSAGQPVTTCVQISASNAVDGFKANSVYALTGTNVTNVLVDSGTNGRSFAVANQNALADYTRDAGNIVASSSTPLSTSTVANLPAAASTQIDSLVLVTDGSTLIDCTSGGGSSRVICRNTGAAWVNLGAGFGTVNSGTGGQLTWYAATGNTVSGNINATISSGTLTLGVASTTAGALILEGATSGSATVSVSATAGTLNLGSTNATVTSAGALTVTSCTGCGSGLSGLTANGVVYGTGATTAASITPPTAGGFWQVGYSLSCGASASVAPQAFLVGLTVRAITGTTSTDTILCSDDSQRIAYQGSVAVAVSLPTPTTLGNAAMVFQAVNNLSTQNDVTITPAGGLLINGAATLAIHQGQKYLISVDPAGGWDADGADSGLIAGTNTTFTRGPHGLTINTSGGITGSGAANEVAVWTSSTNISGFAGFTSDSSGNLTVAGINATSGASAGYFLCDQGTQNGTGGTNTLRIECPTAVTAYDIVMPGTIGSSNQILQIASVVGSVATLQWGSAGGSNSLSGLSAATGTNTLANGNFGQTWNWNLTSVTTGMAFGESTAASAGAIGGNLVSISTLASSTLQTLLVSNSITGSQTIGAENVKCTWNTTGVVDACLIINVANNNSGTGSLPFDVKVSGSSVASIDKLGNITTNGATAGYLALGQGPDNSNATNSILLEAPTSVTSYRLQLPGVKPTNNFSAILCSNASPGVCSFAKMPQTAQITSQYTNSTTSFTNVTGLSFAVEANTNYVMSCTLYYQAASTGGLNIEFTGPASPTSVTYSLLEPGSVSTLVNASVATAYSTSLGAVVTTATTNFPATVTMGLVNGTTAGTVQLLAKSSAAVQLQIQAGSWCQLQ